MELSGQIIAELRSLVERVAVGQPTPAKKFLFETLFGMLASGSVLLTEVGRKLPPTGTLHAVEKRLSRQLGSARWDEATLAERYVAWVAPQVKPDTVLALDVSDIRKAYAEKMACLGKVHDGSTGEIATGYWLLAVEAHRADGTRLGLYLQAWSAQSEEFESENREMLRAVGLVERYAPRRALRAIDSAGDRSRLHRAFKQLGVRYLVRVKRERVVSWHGQRHKIMAVAGEALWCGSFRFAHRTRRGRWLRVRRLVLLVGVAYGFMGLASRKGKRVVKKLVELARRLRPPKKVIAYAIRKGIAALWAAGLLKRPSFGFG